MAFDPALLEPEEGFDPTLLEPEAPIALDPYQMAVSSQAVPMPGHETQFAADLRTSAANLGRTESSDIAQKAGRFLNQQTLQPLPGEEAPALAGLTTHGLGTSRRFASEAEPPLPSTYELTLRNVAEGGTLTPEEVRGTRRGLATALANPEDPEALDQARTALTGSPDNIDKIISGADKAVVDTAVSFAEPENLPFLGLAIPGIEGVVGTAAVKALTAAFMADMASQAPDMYQQVAEALKSDDPQKKAEVLGKAAIGHLFFAFMGAHLTEPRVREAFEKLPPETKARIAEANKSITETPLPERTTPNAIPERGPAQIPLGKTPEAGGEVGQGIPKPEAPAETQAPVQSAETKAGEAALEDPKGVITDEGERNLFQQFADRADERGVDAKVVVLPDDQGISGLKGRAMDFAPDSREIRINREQLMKDLAQFGDNTEAQFKYLDEVFQHEEGHAAVTKNIPVKEGGAVWKDLSKVQQKLVERSYGKWAEGTTDNHKGHEYLRRLNEWSMKQSPIELSQAKGLEWMTQKGIDLSLRGIHEAQKRLPTKGGERLRVLLGRMENNLSAAKAIKSGQSLSSPEKVSEENPKDLIEKVGKMSPVEFADWAGKAKGGFTTEAYRLGDAVDSQKMADHLKSESDRLNAEGMAAFKERTVEAINRGSALVSQAQFFKEAWQRATGVGSGGEQAIKEGKTPKYSAEPKVESLSAPKREDEPVIKALFKGGKEMAGDLQKAVRPPSVSIEAEKTAGTMREKVAELARKDVVAQTQFNKARTAFEKMGPGSSVAFIDRMERGQAQPTPEMEAVADAMRKGFAERVKEVRALGTDKLQTVVQNYFPHIWKDPDAARSFYDKVFSKRPLRGSASFLKQRTIPTISDGLKAGLELESWNPVDATLARLHEMDRYVMGQKVINEMKRQGLLKFSTSLEMPEGHARLNDPLGTVIQIKDTPSGGKERVVRGYYSAPADAARIINNYLSPGLQNFAWYKALRGSGNAMNQVQLGLSFFHGMFTALDSATSKTALGIEQISRGNYVRGVGNVLKGTVGNILTNPLENFLKGNKVLKEYTKPGAVGGEYAQIVNQLIKAGGRGKMDLFYKNSAAESFWRAIADGNYGKALLHGPFAAIEYAAKPLMEGMVPRMKLGIFSDMARMEMERLGPNATPEQMRQVLGKAWDSVENRMGQMAYDNLFWNKTLKDLLMVSVRSVGWNFGTFRELGGGVLDTAKIASRLRNGDPAVTHRMAYMVALPLTVGLAGAVYHYLHNGQGPQTMLDYFAPKTGKKNSDGTDERIQLPSYIKDIMAMARHPLKTIGHKLHPLAGTIADMLNNKDFYGTKIVNQDDPLVKQVADEAKFVGSQFVPFSVQSGTKRVHAKGEIGPVVESFVGLVPAAKELSRSKAMNRMVEMYMDKKPEGGVTKEQKERSDIRRELLSQYRSGDKTAIAEAKAAGRISPSERRKLVSEVKKDGSTVMFKRLSADEALTIYDLGTPEEKAKWKSAMRMKLNNAIERQPERAKEFKNIRRSLSGSTNQPQNRFDPALLVPE